MKKPVLIAFVALAGLFIGFLAFQFSGSGNYCTEVESGLRSNASFNGSIACYPPGVVNVNVSDKIREESDVECVCIHSFSGRQSIFTVTRSS